MLLLEAIEGLPSFWQGKCDMQGRMSRCAQFALVSVVLGGILLILVCPQPQLAGSYQATHGPTVTLRSLGSLLLLMLAIAAAAGSLAGKCYFGHDRARNTGSATLGSVLLC